MYLVSISYGFMQYNIAQSNNILWLDGVYMLPIILAGIETVFRKNKISFCLTMSVCL